MTGDFDTAVRSILGQMIEAREDQNDAVAASTVQGSNGLPSSQRIRRRHTFLDYHPAGRATRMISGNTERPISKKVRGRRPPAHAFRPMCDRALQHQGERKSCKHRVLIVRKQVRLLSRVQRARDAAGPGREDPRPARRRPDVGNARS